MTPWDPTERYREELLQHRGEHEEFVALLLRENVRSYLEIGSMYGGSLWQVACALPRESRVVSVDFGIDTPAAQPHLVACVQELNRIGYDAHLILGDSTRAATVDKARQLGPYDCLFVDGAHTLEAVTCDWMNYGQMARIVAFHDIAWNATWKSKVPGRSFKEMGVPKLWESLKLRYRTEEIKLRRPSNYYGIGVLYRPASE